MKDRPRPPRTTTLRKTALALLLAAVLLPACSPDQGGGTPSPEPSATPTASVTTPADPSASPSADAETSVPAPAPDPSPAPSGPGQGNAELSIIVTAAEGEPETSFTLVCTEGVPAAESVHPAPDAACTALKENAGLLNAYTPGTAQACTQQWGGPQEATVTGVVDGVPVDSTFSRTNGCEISAWDAARDVLGVAGGA